tara:strand:- start:514 stop:1425 length:912 start_codon:yes stop_codon:yes gene_type:complete
MRARLGFETALLPDPEAGWSASEGPQSAALDRAELEARIGPLSGEPELLAVSEDHLDLRLGPRRRLRLYLGSSAARETEAALLSHPWRWLTTPEVVASGPDYLLTEVDPRGGVLDGPEHGEALGRALAEVHSLRLAGAGTLGASLPLGASVSDWFTDWFSAESEAALAALAAAPALRSEVGGFLRARAPDLRAHASPLTLLHGGFKVSNLSCTGPLPWVGGWEGARAGPALQDLGRLFRWGASAGFREAVAAGYRAQGGSLPQDWRRSAGWFDVFSLCREFKSAPPSSLRAERLASRIQRATI